MTRSAHNERDHEAEQARLNEAHDREHHGYHDNPPPVTRYVLKKPKDVGELTGDGQLFWFFECKQSHWTQCFTDNPSEARRFASATEAALFAAEHGIADVEVVPV